jgi:hypothetical protein
MTYLNQPLHTAQIRYIAVSCALILVQLGNCARTRNTIDLAYAINRVDRSPFIIEALWVFSLRRSYNTDFRPFLEDLVIAVVIRVKAACVLEGIPVCNVSPPPCLPTGHGCSAHMNCAPALLYFLPSRLQTQIQKFKENWIYALRTLMDIDM